MFKEKLDYALSVLDCRQIQVALALQQWGIPAELLYYNVCVSSDVIYDHLFVKKLKTWMFDSPCFKVSELDLIKVPYSEKRYDDYFGIEHELKETSKDQSSVFLWVVCGQVPYVKPTHFADLQALHSFWIKGWSEEQGVSAYRVKDTYPEFEGWLSEEEIIPLCSLPTAFNQEQAALTVYRTDGIIPTNQRTIIKERHETWMNSYRDEFLLYDSIIGFVNGTKDSPFEKSIDLYECCAHAFKFLGGSRYLYSCYLERNDGEASTITLLQQTAQKARALKQTFLMAIYNGKINQEVVIRICQELKQLEQDWSLSLRSSHVI
ncbi:hypothetical protein [Paenibacillus sp. 1001270B_150601_E10]|uniref:hypothetical protein n=1 Tax=Paenibacillus sp. 1001270B_150601_E10 TaxID=2787079 RepID=UPI00189E6A7E|nr:hypothetical protein [Paenibacillus sp. 1001270B_150601_E10]